MALEAERLDRVINALPDKLNVAVVQRWMSSLGTHYQAIFCRCSVQTFYTRINRGHEEIGAKLHKAVFEPPRYIGTPHVERGLSLNEVQI